MLTMLHYLLVVCDGSSVHFYDSMTKSHITLKIRPEGVSLVAQNGLFVELDLKLMHVLVKV